MAGYASLEDIRATLLPALAAGTVVEEFEGNTGTVNLVRVRLGASGGEEFEATIVFGIDRCGNPAVSRDGSLRAVFLKTFRALRHPCET